MDGVGTILRACMTSTDAEIRRHVASVLEACSVHGSKGIQEDLVRDDAGLVLADLAECDEEGVKRKAAICLNSLSTLGALCAGVLPRKAGGR